MGAVSCITKKRSSREQPRMIEVEIDGRKVEVPEGSMLMEAANRLGIYVPHFCYHKKLKAVIPGGSSMPVLPADIMMATDMDYDSIAKAGSMLGSGAVIVMNETRCMVQAAERLAYFYYEESCGQCTPCREGTGWMWRVMERLVEGNAEIHEIDTLYDVTKQVEGHTICALGDAAAMPVRAFVKVFRDEFQHHIDNKCCTVHPGGYSTEHPHTPVTNVVGHQLAAD